MSERTKAAPRSAAWGAACAPCARAKARCIRSNKIAGEKCDRCENLEKHCVEQAPKIRKKRQTKISKAEQLETRLNDLIESLKRPEQSLGYASTQARGSSEDSKAHLSPGFTADSPDKNNMSEPSPSGIAPLPGYNPSARPTCTCQEIIEQEDLVPPQPDKVLLSIYRSQMSAQFPFVIIPPQMTVAELRRTRPFLLKVIRMIASIRNRRSMWGQSHAVMRHITEATMIRSERSLDLLQGLLVFTGYFHYYCMAHGQFNNLINLATSMVTDMGIDRRFNPRKKHQFAAMDRDEPRILTNEERRAVLGVWYMSSNAALTWNRMHGAVFTRHLQQCQQDMEEAPEYDTDGLLVELIKIQNLTERIFRFNHREELLDAMPGLLSPQESDAMLYIATYKMELEGLRSSVPAWLDTNYLLSSHYSTANIRLYETIIANSHLLEEQPSPSMSSGSFSNQSEYNLHYAAAAEALQGWFDTWLSIPVCYYFYMPQPGLGHLIFAVTMLMRRARLVLLSWGQPGQTSATGSTAGTTPSDCPGHNTSSANYGMGVSQGLMTQPLVALAGRLEYAKQEIGAAHGVSWKNDFLDIVAINLRSRADRIEKWCALVDTKGFLPRKHKLTTDLPESQHTYRGIESMLYEQGHTPVFSDADLENWLWAGDFFDGTDLNPVGLMDGFGEPDPVTGGPMGTIPVDPCVVYQETI